MNEAVNLLALQFLCAIILWKQISSMPSPKGGKAGNAIAPAAPASAIEADKANPDDVGKIKASQREAKAGKYGSVSSTPHKAPTSKEDKEAKKSWIEIELVDTKKKPVAGEEYRVTLPDGQTAAEGNARRKRLCAGRGL